MLAALPADLHPAVVEGFFTTPDPDLDDASPAQWLASGGDPQRVPDEAEGLDEVFTDAGGEWRLAGCSMCLGMNPDQLAPGERCASTSNRNFEGRQGARGRTHLVSPAVAAATAVAGHFAIPADLDRRVDQ